MIIDFHTHVHTPEDQADPFWQGRCPMTIENALEAMKSAGIDMTVISLPMHAYLDEATQDRVIAAVRDAVQA